MLPESLLEVRIAGTSIEPCFLGEHDHSWLRLLLDERDRFVGRPRRELLARLAEPLAGKGAARKQKLAVHVLEKLGRARPCHAVLPRRARAEVFGEAARVDAPRDEVLATVAGRLGVAADALEAALFADLPGEQLVASLPQPLLPLELALRANLALAGGLVARASTITIESESNARALVRHARLKGLIVTVLAHDSQGRAAIDVSGPLALFRHTLLYGRALAELLPILAWCRRFQLRATCILAGQPRSLRLGSGDPIFPATEPRQYDSRLEERFARDFRRAAPDWDVVREPEPVSAGGRLVFPDFALTWRTDPRRRWLLEIVGFWTPEYLSRKLADYRAAGLPNLILCIDESRRCAEGDLPQGARVVRFRRRVDAAQVLRIVKAEAVPKGEAS